LFSTGGPSPVDDPHPAAAELALDHVAADGRPISLAPLRPVETRANLGDLFAENGNLRSRAQGRECDSFLAPYTVRSNRLSFAFCRLPAWSGLKLQVLEYAPKLIVDSDRAV